LPHTLLLSGIWTPHSGQGIVDSGKGLPHCLQVLFIPGFLAPHSVHFFGAAACGGLKHIFFTPSSHILSATPMYFANIVPSCKNPIFQGFYIPWDKK
jgi:hypothetical protein